MAEDEKTERDHARERIYNSVGGPGRATFPDGTIVEDGVVVKRGPRAIINEEGRVVGMKPEE